MTMRSIARAVWFRDRGLAHALLRRSLLAQQHLEWKDGLPSIRDPQDFDDRYNEIQRADKRRAKAKAEAAAQEECEAGALSPEALARARSRARRRYAAQ
eukprot:15467027-Alexandrium_andersonii.AAC.1